MLIRFYKNMKWWFETKNYLKPYKEMRDCTIYVNSHWRKNKLKKWCGKSKFFKCKVYKNKVFISRKVL